MNLEKIAGLMFVLTVGIVIFVFVLSPQPKYQDAIDLQMSRQLFNEQDYEMHVLRVNVFENKENAINLNQKIQKYSYLSYIEELDSNSNLWAVYIGPLPKEIIDRNLDHMYEVGETESGEIIQWKP
jgi:cell division septation protein DedD